MNENDFWELTPREFNALVERYKSTQERLDYRTALICSVMANLWRDNKKKREPFSPADFMPSNKTEKHTQSPAQIFATVKMLNTLLGGEVREL